MTDDLSTSHWPISLPMSRGFFFNSLAHIPFAEIQANGNAKLTALIHLLEVIPYLLLLFYLVEKYGVVGAAIAWSVRYTIDFFILFILCCTR